MQSIDIQLYTIAKIELQLSDRRAATKQMTSCISVFGEMETLFRSMVIREQMEQAEAGEVDVSPRDRTKAIKALGWNAGELFGEVY